MPLVSPRHLFLDPLVEDLALLLSLVSLGEDLSLPLVAATVVEEVLAAVLGLVVVEVVLDQQVARLWWRCDVNWLRCL